MRNATSAWALGGFLVLVSGPAVYAGPAGFVVRREGTWTVGPPPGRPLEVGETVEAGDRIHPPEKCSEGDVIVLALYHRDAPVEVACGGPRGRTPWPVEGGPATSLAARILEVVHKQFLEHKTNYQPTAARSEPQGVALRLQSAVLVQRDEGLSAVPSLAVDGSEDGESTYALRRIDDGAKLRPDDGLTISVRRSGAAERITTNRPLEPALYDVWDGVGIDQRPEGVPARLGTWILVVPPERSAVQGKFRDALRAIKSDPHTQADRTSILRAYLMSLAN